MSYFAEIHPDTKQVLRVIVADSADWCQSHLPSQVQTGTELVDDGEGGQIEVPVFAPTSWVETSDPYSGEPQTVAYTGPGHRYDPGVVERFVGDEWSLEKATVPDEDGLYRYRTNGELTWHNGRAWRNLMPDDTPNVWEPPTNWREYPMGAEHPLWVQPSGAVDAYPLDFVVEHGGKTWRNATPANVWEPGAVADLWEDISPVVEPPPVEAWQVWSGLNEDLYQIGDVVTHNGQTWQANTGNNHWEPGVFGWDVI